VLRTVATTRGKRKRVLVLQGLKTDESRRTMVLPQVCLEALRAHRVRQLEERMKGGARWSNAHDLVFTTRRGGLLDPRNVLRSFHTVLVTAGITPRRRFHDPRHSAAAILIAQGVPLVEVSMLLGHSEIRTTADLYAHLVKQTAARAATMMDAPLKPAAKA